MKRKVFRLFMDYEKEEAWLNSLANQGWNLVSFTVGVYTFERGTPGEYTYRLELLDNLPSHMESKNYLEFMEESGIECVDTHLRWVYFRKKRADGPFTLYSDNRSKIRHYQRIVLLFGVIGLANLVTATANASHSMQHLWGNSISAVQVLTLLNFLVSGALLYKAGQYLLKIRRLKKETLITE